MTDEALFKREKAGNYRKDDASSNCSISKLKTATGISDATLYNWRKQAKAKGLVVPGDGRNPEDWSSEDKFMVVLESATLNEAELAKYRCFST